jgi:hypothetical protein
VTIEMGSGPDCGGPCTTCDTAVSCLDSMFPDGYPETVQGEFDGNSYSTSGTTPSQTTTCCDTWTPAVLDLGLGTTPSCYPAGFTNSEYSTAILNGCVVDYGWTDGTCGSPSADRYIWVTFAKHPVTGNIWIFTGAVISFANPAPLEWEVTVGGWLDTGLTEILSTDGPFTVPLDASCTVEFDNPDDSTTYTNLGCWSTALGDVVVTI